MLGKNFGLIKSISGLVRDLFRSQAALEAEILVLRQQIIVLQRWAWSVGCFQIRVTLSVPKIRFYNYGDEVRLGPAPMWLDSAMDRESLPRDQ